MIRPATTLQNYQLLAADGVVGDVVDFLFDDDCWQVRYFVIDAGQWLSARRVLIAPEAVHQPEWDAKRLPTALSKDQVRESPEYQPNESFTRQGETSLRRHYGWESYWETSARRGGSTNVDSSRRGEAVPDQHPEAVTPAVSPGAGADAEMAAAMRGAEDAQAALDEPRLRSVRDVIGYHVEASDGSVGHVEDFLLDDGSWEVRFIVVDTRNWWPGKKVRLPVQAITSVSWPESHIVVALTRDEIKAAPAYDPDEPGEDTGAASGGTGGLSGAQ